MQALLSSMEAAHPRLLADVGVLMSEAERITVTWDERWLTLLGELDVDVARRCVTLQVCCDVR